MGNFSLVGIADKILGTNARDTFLGNLAGGNDVTGVASILTGDDPTGSFASAVSVSGENALKGGIGTPLRIGGNTAPAFQTLFPRLGRPAQALLRSQGLSTALGTVTDILDFKLEVDGVLTAALLAACR
jgi:hypothetical protein